MNITIPMNYLTYPTSSEILTGGVRAIRGGGLYTCTNKQNHTLTNLHSVLSVLLFKLSLLVKLQWVVKYKILWYVGSLDFSMKTWGKFYYIYSKIGFQENLENVF